MTSPEVGAAARRIAAALRIQPPTGDHRRTIEFLLRDDTSLRAVDVVTAGRRRVLMFEAYRGSAAVLNALAVMRKDGPTDAPWFADGMSVRDEGAALGIIEQAVDVQLSGADFARHPSDDTVDVRVGSLAAEYAPRFTRAEHAEALTRVPLAVAFWAYLAVWVCYPIGISVAPSAVVAYPSLIGMLLAQLVATIAVAAAGFGGRGGLGALVVLAVVPAVIMTPLAVVAAPIGPSLALVGGALTVVGAVLAAGAPRRAWWAPAVFVFVGAAAIVISIAMPALTAVWVVAGGMLAAAIGAGVLVRRAPVTPSAR